MLARGGRPRVVHDFVERAFAARELPRLPVANGSREFGQVAGPIGRSAECAGS